MPSNHAQSLDPAQRELAARRDHLSKQIAELDRALAGIAEARRLLSSSNGHVSSAAGAPKRIRGERPVPPQFDAAIRKAVGTTAGDFSTTDLVVMLGESPYNIRMKTRDRDFVTRALRKLATEQAVINVQPGMGRRPAMWRRATK